MAVPSTSAHARVAQSSWRILALLVLSVAINYIDRGSLSIAAPLLKDEIGISASHLGYLLSSFFWTYSAFQVVSGWLVDRFDANRLLAAGFLLWSAATTATGFINGFAMLLVLRLILGIGESVAYPCYSKILASHFAEHQRGFANSLIDAGTKCGPALGTLAGGVLMARFGWRSFFVVLGAVSLIWIPAWLRWMPRGQGSFDARHTTAPGILEILRRRSAWATFAGHFCGNYFFYFLLTWLPFYLVRERHFSMSLMASVGSLAYIVTGLATTIAGWRADRAIARGGSPTRVRKTCTAAGLAFATIVVAVAATSDALLSMTFLMLACTAYGVFASSHWAISQTLAGPAAAGKWTGLQNFFANLAGVAAPAITGLTVDKTGHFFYAFAAAAAVVLAGSAIYLFMLGPVVPVQWTTSAVSTRPENECPPADESFTR